MTDMSNINQNPTNSGTSLNKKIESAKNSGKLNIPNLSLETLPKELFKGYYESNDTNWWNIENIQQIDASYNSITEEFMPEGNDRSKTSDANSLTEFNIKNSLAY